MEDRMMGGLIRTATPSSVWPDRDTSYDSFAYGLHVNVLDLAVVSILIWLGERTIAASAKRLPTFSTR
jgi:hypothetical protein